MTETSTRSPGWVLCLDKPAGPTSFELVRRVRRRTGYRRVGHAGTLDPFATGLLVLAGGGATRLLRFLAATDKRYVALVRFGQSTDTDDATGNVLASTDLVPDEAALRAELGRWIGLVAQRPPQVSAVKVAGRRAYSRFRRGERVAPLPERRVRIESIELLSFAPPRASLAVECGSGTYIRSLARDLGEALGCGAHLEALRRERVGSLQLRDAVTLEAFEAGWHSSPPSAPGLLRPEEALGDLPRARLEPEEVARVRHGLLPEALAGRLASSDATVDGDTPQRTRGESAAVPAWIVLLDTGGKLVAVARREAAGLALEMVLAQESDGDLPGTV